MGSDRNAVVIEDDADVRNLLMAILHEAGFTCVAAGTGIEGINAVREHQPILTTLDVSLPGIDGYEVARRLRARPETAGALIVAVTGYGQKEDRERSRAAGFDHHLVKPIESDALLKLLGGQGDAA